MAVVWVLLIIHGAVTIVGTPIAIIAQESKRCAAVGKAVRIKGAMLEVYCEEVNE